MERLTGKFRGRTGLVDYLNVSCNKICNRSFCEDCPIEKAFEKLAHYEDLEEQGLLHKAEIKDGTPIWYIASLADGEPFLMKSSYIYNVTEYEVGSLEKDFWLSEEEAEAILKELENE